jgi:peptide subunit release factor 1 (eRF1)
VRLDPEIEQRLQRLRRLPKGRSVLSVYLATEPGLALHHGHVSQLMDTLRDLKESLAPNEQERLSVEAERVLSFVRQEYVPHGQTLVIFSSKPRRLWEVLSLQLPLSSQARFSTVPYLTPVDVALEDYPRVAVALVSQERARLMTTILAEIEQEHQIKEHVPGRQRQGGWSAFKYPRDRERHIHEHFVNIAGELQELQKRLPYKWLVIGGTDDATSALTGLLPNFLRTKLAGTFNDELFERDNEIAVQGARLAEGAERGEELKLAEDIRDRAMAGGAAALGWEETLQCLTEGRAHRLAIAGSRLGSGEANKALELASDSGALIEVVHGEAEKVLAPNGGIGALLRY